VVAVATKENINILYEQQLTRAMATVTQCHDKKNVAMQRWQQPNNNNKTAASNLLACSFCCSFVAAQWGAGSKF